MNKHRSHKAEELLARSDCFPLSSGVSVYQITENVFCAAFGDFFDLAMTFMRANEFTESPDPKIRGNPLKLIELIKLYSMESGGSFNYAAEMGAFALEKSQIRKTIRGGLADTSEHDFRMLALFGYCSAMCSGDWVLIGIPLEKDSIGFFAHELAHAFYAQNKSYRSMCDTLVSEMSTESRQYLFDSLASHGYASDVLMDEAQAYLSTGVFDNIRAPKEECKPFEDLFDSILSEVIHGG